MSRRTLLNKYQILNAVDSSLTQTSTPTDISGLDYITYQLLAGALVDSVLEVQVCNDVVLSPSSVFVSLEFSNVLSIIGVTDIDYMVTVENQGFRHAKIQLTNNGGSGTINAWISGTTRSA